jgi:hypothetical protein
VAKVLMDRFPCHLSAIAAGKIEDITTMRSFEPTQGSTYLEITRVIVTDEHIIVFRETYEEFLPSKEVTKDSFVVTSSGKMVAFKKDTGCGCGSRLRGWNPYATLNSIKD